MTPLAIYMHWPFCQSKCPYCDFNSHVAATIDHAAWREAYRKELRHYAQLLPDRCRVPALSELLRHLDVLRVKHPLLRKFLRFRGERLWELIVGKLRNRLHGSRDYIVLLLQCFDLLRACRRVIGGNLVVRLLLFERLLLQAHHGSRGAAILEH